MVISSMNKIGFSFIYTNKIIVLQKLSQQIKAYLAVMSNVFEKSRYKPTDLI